MSEFARQRRAYYEVLRVYNRWCALLDSEAGPGAAQPRGSVLAGLGTHHTGRTAQTS